MKQIKITLKDLFDLPTASLYNAQNFTSINSVSIDSRTVKKNSLFIAIKGEKFDGHDFVSKAIRKGAKAVVINESSIYRFEKLKVTLITVEDTVKALGVIASIWRLKLNAKVIAITGSNGKTSTKEILSTILSEKFKVRSTISNNNNHIGVPITILSSSSKDELLVLELGTNHFGEIAYSSSIVNPNYSLITNIGASHLEFLKNEIGVLKEKEELFKVTDKNNGIVFINEDDKKLKPLKQKYSNAVTYGFNNYSDVRCKLIGYEASGNTKIQIEYKKVKFTLSIPLLGIPNAQNVLAAITVALKLGLTKQQIISGVKKLKPSKQRLNVFHFDNSILIDDSYNANPLSMKSALDLVKQISIYKHKVVILGDMFELGSKTNELHRGLASAISKNNINMVLTIGKAMQNLFNELTNKKVSAFHFADRNSLKSFVLSYDFADSIILIKGSRGMKMEEFVTILKEIL